VFYVFGILGCVWSAAWFFLCYDSPTVHPRISVQEKEYWNSVLGTTNLLAHPPTPWKKILTSFPVWALAVAFFANDWGFFTLATCIPLFMHDVLGFNMTKNGTLSAVPFLASGLMIPSGKHATSMTSLIQICVPCNVFCWAASNRRDADYCYRCSRSLVCVSMCLSVCHVSIRCAKMAEWIEVLLGAETRIGAQGTLVLSVGEGCNSRET